MEPDRWQEVKRIFDSALERPAGERAGFVRAACGGGEELLREVMSLLESDQTAASFFEQPLVPPRKPAPDPIIGRTFGVYRVIREIGQGGMGSVYLAMRDDDQFRRRVALKAVRREYIDDAALRRFQNERQTLAVLDHPNIIGLLDGGTTEDGLPYLVMDYVEGQPIDEYCDSRKLSVPERLQLFRTVCAAVHYAHQNLVVHRDLKPSNILVTPEGVPKLLDFGIAKLLKPEYSTQTMGLTRTRLQPMTPKYASPEQILGQPITTASDIYSLGVLLYVLLTDSHPFDRNTQSMLQLQRAICEEDPEKPSIAVTHTPRVEDAVPAKFQEVRRDSLARRLRGDVDMIVLMAMRKEPQRRYESAAHLAEDVRRHLEGLPVLARKRTVRYRVHKFVTRHKLGMAAAALIAASMLTSAVVASRSWMRAERRFKDLWQFSKLVVQEMDNALRTGSTRAREKVLTQAVKTLDGLAGESKGDAALQRDLIEAYLETGDTQGNLFVGNLGKKDQAEGSYRKALALAEVLYGADPANAENQRLLASTFVKLGDGMGDPREQLEQYRKARQIYEASAKAGTRTAAASAGLLFAQTRIASAQENMGDPNGALESYRRGLEYAAGLKAGAIAFCQERIAWYSAITGETAGAEEMVQDAIHTYRNTATKRGLAKAHKTLAEVQKRTGKIPEALGNARKSLEMIAELRLKDPSDQQLQIDYEQGMVLLVDLLGATGDKAEQRRRTAEALQLVKPLLATPNIRDYQIHNYAWLLLTTPFPELQDYQAALKYAGQVVAMTREGDPGALDLLARAYEKNGDAARAVEQERKALALLPPVPPGGKPSELRMTLEKNLAEFESRLRQAATPRRQ